MPRWDASNAGEVLVCTASVALHTAEKILRPVNSSSRFSRMQKEDFEPELAFGNSTFGQEHDVQTV